jgi:hypothetical protein
MGFEVKEEERRILCRVVTKKVKRKEKNPN